MDAEQLWDTTMNPETRLLKKVRIESAREASKMTELLMGNDVPSRKTYIHDNAQYADLDI